MNLLYIACLIKGERNTLTNKLLYLEWTARNFRSVYSRRISRLPPIYTVDTWWYVSKSEDENEVSRGSRFSSKKKRVLVAPSQHCVGWEKDFYCWQEIHVFTSQPQLSWNLKMQYNSYKQNFKIQYWY